MRARAPLALATLLALILPAAADAEPRVTGAERSATEVEVLAAGGLAPLHVSVALKEHAVTYGVAASLWGTLPIGLSEDEIDPAGVTAAAVAVGNGRFVVHVHVPSKERQGVAWEALLVGRQPAVLWSGVTGFASGEAGELAGEALDLLPPDDTGTRVVVLGEVRQDLRICGQEQTLLSPRVLDPQSLAFRGATMQRLPEDQRDDAEAIVASSHGGPADPPLARLLLATGASTAIGAPSSITDGDPATTWSEGRPSDGHGEFVVMRAPFEVPIARLAITVAPPSPSPHGAAPKSFFLVTENRTIAVTMPEDAWLHPGVAYDIPLPEPLVAGCLTLVLDKAYTRREAHPAQDVTIAELTAYSAFDAPGAGLAEVAKALGGGGARGDAAKGVLERAGDPGLAAAAAAYPTLDASGRALAIDAAIGAGTCEASAPLLLAATVDRDREVARKGRDKLERCGKRAAPAYLAALKSPDERLRATAARLAAEVAPSEALGPLTQELGEGGALVRSAVRDAIAKAVRASQASAIAEMLRAPRADAARIELLRALEERLPSAASDADAAIAELSQRATSMPSRYLLVDPVASLARAGDEAEVRRLVALVATDPDAAVRAHAAERAGGVPGAIAALAHAVEADDSPRVRGAALEALTATSAGDRAAAIGPASRKLAKDEWTFVRSAAANALASFPARADADAALETGLDDRAATVKEAVILALSAHHDAHAAKRIRARLEDPREAIEVRLASASALATLCDRDSVELLTTIARRAPLAMASDEDIQLGFAAAEALGRIHPADLAARLAPLADKDARIESRTAAARALATAPGCK
jgi:HEAT repeat protein